MQKQNKPDPLELKTYQISNNKGTVLNILNLGAAVFSLVLKDRKGSDVNVVVGPQHPDTFLSEDYIEDCKCFGASIGRYAGRISNGRFVLDGEEYQLFEEDGVHLHGGYKGLHHKIWNLESQHNGSDPFLEFSCYSEEGEEGYPGNLQLRVKYTLTEDDELKILYTAVSDKKTVINLANHTYFNLNGGGSVSEQLLSVKASHILETDEKLLPTGGFTELEGKPKNFSKEKKIDKLQIDDTFILQPGKEPAASLYCENTGIEMKVNTNQPGIVVYVPEALPAKWQYQNPVSEFPSICLETQNFPDAPNFPTFPSAVLYPRETYTNESSFKFSIRKVEN